MLDVHPPHEAAHTWKDFLIHIATIVVGLLIAIGLEQGVEWLHHRHQLHQLVDSLDKELDQNLDAAARDIVALDNLVALDEQNKVKLDEAGRSGAQTPLVLVATPLIEGGTSTSWSVPTDATITAARDNGTLSLLPQPRARFLARLEFTTTTLSELTHQLFDAEYHVRALEHLHADPSAMTAEERHSLLVAISDREQIALHTRLVLVRMTQIIRQER